MTKQSHLNKEQIASLQSHLLKDQKQLEKTIIILEKQDPFKDPEHVLDNAAIDTDVREQLGHSTIEATVKSLRKKLTLVEKALHKLSTETYGYDEKTGDPIPYERLRVVPETPYTVETEQRYIK